MATPISKLSLEELYARAKEKVTPAVAKAIILHPSSDFTRINPTYCDAICKLRCKSHDEVRLSTQEVDILIIQDHRDPPGKFETRPSMKNRQETLQEGVVNFLAQQAGFYDKYKPVTWKVVSLLKCAATHTDFPSGKPPSQTTLQKCLPYLKHELEQSKPKVIISLGTASTKSLGLTKHSNTGNRGQVVSSEWGPVVLTLHPRILSYIRQNARGAGGLWGPDYLRVIQRDFEKARKIATGEISWGSNTLGEAVAFFEVNRIKIATTLDEVREIMAIIEALPPEDVVSFDTETTSVDPLDPLLKILTIQFGWRDPATGHVHAGVIPLWHRKNRYYSPDEAWEIVHPFLTGPRPKVGHNAKFDILVLYWATGIRVLNVIYDTLLLLHSIESGTQGCYSLKAAAWDHLMDLGFAGYEDLLGDLSKLKPEEDVLDEEEELYSE